MATFVSLISGSSGNATFVSDGKTNLLIDCGMSGAKLKESLHAIDVMPESIDALLITHEQVQGLFQDATIFLFTLHKVLIQVWI